MHYDHEIDILCKLASYQRQSLNRGLAMRAKMHNDIEAGKDVDNYRVRWIKESCVKIFALLEKVATEFNETHIGDRASSLDLSDVLTSAIATLQENSED